MKCALSSLIVLASICLGTTPSWSQSADDPFALLKEQRVVEAASRHEQPVSEAPAEVTVISAEEIARFGWATLADVLRSVRGFYVSDDHNYSYAGVRGFSRPSDYNNRLLLMLDGHKMNGAVYEDALIGTEMPLDLRALKRIEIVRGPVSALYGTDGIFGAINLVTRDARGPAAADATGMLGSAAALRGHAGGRFELGPGVGLMVSQVGFDDPGRDLAFPELASPSNPSGLVRGGDADRGRGFLMELSSRLGTLEAFYSGRTKHVPTASYGAIPFNTDNYTYDSRGFVELRTARQFSATLGLDARVYLNGSHYDGHGWYPQPRDSTAPAVLDVDMGEGWSAGTEVRLSKALSGNHTLQLGVEGETQPEAWQRTYDAAPFYQYIDDKHNSRRLSLYAQDELILGPRLSGTFALRHDMMFGSDFNSSAANPHVGLVYKVSPEGVVKLLAGSSFRRPTPYELYYFPAYNGSAFVDLRPERALGIEAAWEQGWSGGGSTVLSGFYDRVRDLIDAVAGGDGLTVFVNRSTARCYGGEMEWQRPAILGGAVTASLVVQRAEDAGGRRMTNAPTLVANARFWHPWPALHLETALEYDHLSSRLTLRDTWVDPVNLVNAQLRFRPGTGRIQLALRVTNLLDRIYSDPAGPEHVETALPQYGRMVRVELKMGKDAP